MAANDAFVLQDAAATRIQAVLRGRASRKEARAVALRELDVLRISPPVPSRLLLAEACFGHAGAYVELMIRCMQGRNNTSCFGFHSRPIVRFARASESGAESGAETVIECEAPQYSAG